MERIFLGSALKRLPGMKFKSVVLAGSVLPREFNWDTRIGHQVERVWNHRAHTDVPVAVLCGALHAFGMRDIGTAGYHGFQANSLPQVSECFYHKGGHAAAVQGNAVEWLVKAVLGCTERQCQTVTNENYWFGLVSRTAAKLPFLLIALAATFIATRWNIPLLHSGLWIIPAAAFMGALLDTV